MTVPAKQEDMMDIDAALDRIRHLVCEIQNEENVHVRADAGDELAEVVGSLDIWLTRGGFLPTDWNAVRV